MAEPKGWGTVAAKRHKTVGVGFKNPSKRGRFRKGQSGNPAGPPKGISNAATVFARVFGKLMDINERGRQKKISKLEVLFTTVLNDAIKGDPRARQQAIQLARSLENPSEVSSAPNWDFTEDDTQVIAQVVERILRSTKMAAP